MFLAEIDNFRRMFPSDHNVEKKMQFIFKMFEFYLFIFIYLFIYLLFVICYIKKKNFKEI
jgi:hypothetical protein